MHVSLQHPLQHSPDSINGAFPSWHTEIWGHEPAKLTTWSCGPFVVSYIAIAINITNNNPSITYDALVYIARIKWISSLISSKEWEGIATFLWFHSTYRATLASLLLIIVYIHVVWRLCILTTILIPWASWSSDFWDNDVAVHRGGNNNYYI